MKKKLKDPIKHNQEKNLPSNIHFLSHDILDKYQSFALKNLGFAFNDLNLFVTALTHRSYLNEHKNSVFENNERLEYLGDAVLELVVSDYLFKEFDEPEGIMTALRSALVRTESIAAAGEAIGYESLIRTSKGENSNTGRARMSIIADCFEAVIGATYLDQGMETAARLIDQFIISRLDGIIKDGTWRDPKSHLQEYAQHSSGFTPRYRILSDTGPDHNKIFEVGVFIGSDLVSKGSGHSKQEAEAKAARTALQQLVPDFIPKRRKRK